MIAVRSWMNRASHSLANRLDRLRQTFDHFREQLREAMSEQIGQAVSGAVREAMFHLLADVPGGNAPARRGSSTSHQPVWQDEQDPWADPDERWEEDHNYDNESAATPNHVQNLNHAVLVGCEAAAFWLRQRWGRLPLVVAFLLAGVSAATSYVGGPIAAAGIALAGSTVSLLALVRTSRMVAEPPPTP